MRAAGKDALGIAFFVSALAYFAVVPHQRGEAMEPKPATKDAIILPAPIRSSDTPVERALAERRSVRSYGEAPLTLPEAGQLLWAAQGVTSARGFRTAPSAGALYPLEVFLVAGDVEGLRPGVYRYVPEGHALTLVVSGDRRGRLCASALGQGSVRRAPAVIVLAAVYARTTGKYGGRGIRYVHMESGSAAQNVYLEAESLGLGTVIIGAFDDAEVRAVLGIGRDEEPLIIMPVGKI